MKDIANLPSTHTRLIGQHVDSLAENPRPHGSKKLEAGMGYSLRVSVYRILYNIDDEKHTVTVFRVKHRREAYR